MLFFDCSARHSCPHGLYLVACGVYGALATPLLDEIPQGIYFDELLLRTSSQYGRYQSYYIADFVVGTNEQAQGLLLDRMIRCG